MTAIVQTMLTAADLCSQADSPLRSSPQMSSSGPAPATSNDDRHITLFYDPISQPSRAVLMFLRENNIKHDVKEVLLEEKAQLKEEFVKINPLHRIPTIIERSVQDPTDEWVLDESMTIMKYLVQSRGLPRHWHPEDPRAQARVNQYLGQLTKRAENNQHCTARSACAFFSISCSGTASSSSALPCGPVLTSPPR